MSDDAFDAAALLREAGRLTGRPLSTPNFQKDQLPKCLGVKVASDFHPQLFGSWELGFFGN